MNGESSTWLYKAGRLLGRFCFGYLGRLEIKGLENLPPHGPVILACNHLSYSDPPLLVVTMPRPLFFVGKKELFGNPLTRFIMRSFHVSPIDRSSSGLDAVRILTRHLEKDRTIVIFPEGHRSPDHTLQQGMLGIAYLAVKSQAPILPVGVTGTHKISAWRMPVPLCRLTTSIGPPFTLPVLEGKPSREVLKSIADMIMERVAAQLPPEFRGAYGKNASIPREAGVARTGTG